MSAQNPVQTCPHCGAGLSLDDLRLPDCKYCKTALPHHARAAEHAALVNQVFQNQGVNYQIGYMHGAPPPPPMYPGPHHYQQQVQQVGDAVAKSVMVSIVVIVLVTVMIVGGMLAFFLVRF